MSCVAVYVPVTYSGLTGESLLPHAEIAIAEPRLVLSELTGPITMSGHHRTLKGYRWNMPITAIHWSLASNDSDCTRAPS